MEATVIYLCEKKIYSLSTSYKISIPEFEITDENVCKYADQLNEYDWAFITIKQNWDLLSKKTKEDFKEEIKESYFTYTVKKKLNKFEVSIEAEAIEELINKHLLITWNQTQK